MTEWRNRYLVDPTACIFYLQYYNRLYICTIWQLRLQVVYWANFNEWVRHLRKAYKGHGRSHQATQPCLFVLPSTSTAAWCTANTWAGGVGTNVNADHEQIQKDSWNPSSSRFMDGQLGWRTLVLETWSSAVCWSDRKFQSGDFCLWSCSVTILKSLWQCFRVPYTMFDCPRMGVSWIHSHFGHLRTRSWVLGGLLKTWNATVFHHWLVLFQWREIPLHTTTWKYQYHKGLIQIYIKIWKLEIWIYGKK